MKLIDADARVTVQWFDIEHEEYKQTEMSVAEALDFCSDEGCPPVVDAISVEWAEEEMGRYEYCGSTDSADVVKALIEGSQKEQDKVPPTQHWISCNDRPPADGEIVLVYTDEDEMFIAEYFAETDDFDDGNGCAWGGNITHWMPRLKPPKVGGVA